MFNCTIQHNTNTFIVNQDILTGVMMKQDTTRALQQSQIKWNDKNTSAAISYIYSKDR